jgi:uncharacterized protein (TIRG00374 family)
VKNNSGEGVHSDQAVIGSRSKSSWQLWLGIIFSLIFLILALRGVDLKMTATTLQNSNILLLCVAAGCFVVSTAAKALRWRLLLASRRPPSFMRAFLILSIGLMVNAFLPARLGEFARAYLMGEAEADSKVYVLGTIVLEKVADLLFLLLSIFTLLFWMKLPKWLIGPARGTALVLLILVISLLILFWKKEILLAILERTSRFLPLKWQEWLGRQARYGLASLDMIRNPRLVIGLFGWSLLIWVLSTLTNSLVFLAMKLSMPIWVSLLLLVVLQIGTAVPSSPGRIGVFQYLVVLSLSLTALDKNVALGYSISLYLVVYSSIALLGVWGLWREKISWGRLNQVVFRYSEGRKSG